MTSKCRAVSAVPAVVVLLVFILMAGALAEVPSAEAGAWMDGVPRLFPSLSEGAMGHHDAFSPGMAGPMPGNGSLPLVAQTEDADEDQMVDEEPMVDGPSPGKAFMLSLAVPGSGEYYAGSKKRAAVFGGLEAVGWGLYSTWNGKGNDLEDDFRARADTTWDPWAYLSWRTSTISRHSSITHALPCSSYVADAGSAVPIGQALGGCGDTETQQYYELIGKYDQFVAGWNDVVDSTGYPVRPTQVDSAENYHSATRLDYEIDRDDSNKLLKRATSLGGLILVNHVLSAIDASRVARARAQGVDAATLERRIRLAFYMGSGAGGPVPMVMAYRLVY